jgi:hypothetical protein
MLGGALGAWESLHGDSPRSSLLTYRLNSELGLALAPLASSFLPPVAHLAEAGFIRVLVDKRSGRSDLAVAFTGTAASSRSSGEYAAKFNRKPHIRSSGQRVATV